jgi:hypothetical protein
MSRRKKQPKVKETPDPSKKPKAPAGRETLHDRPAWRLARVDAAGPFAGRPVDLETLQRLHEKLASFESMTWDEIIVKSRKNNHFIPTKDLSKEARHRLEELKADDVDELLSIRLSGRERLFGIWDAGIVDLLWWDPEHRVCRSTRIHT